MHGLDAENISSSKSTYGYLVILADALARSRFLKTLVDNHYFMNKERKERAEKLKRGLGKVCQYLSGITHLIQKAKRLPFMLSNWARQQTVHASVHAEICIILNLAHCLPSPDDHSSPPDWSRKTQLSLLRTVITAFLERSG